LLTGCFETEDAAGGVAVNGGNDGLGATTGGVGVGAAAGGLGAAEGGLGAAAGGGVGLFGASSGSFASVFLEGVCENGDGTGGFAGGAAVEASS